jgi:hypothetical protein
MDLNSTDIKLIGGNIEPDASGDAVTVSGVEVFYQDICCEAVTQKGDLFYDLDYGWNLGEYIHVENSEMIRLAIKQRVISELSERDNIIKDSIQVTVKYSKEQFNLSVEFKIVDFESERILLQLSLDRDSNEVIIL